MGQGSLGARRRDVGAAGRPGASGGRLTEGREAEILDGAREMFDVIIVDGPPMLDLVSRAVRQPDQETLGLLHWLASHLRTIATGGVPDTWKRGWWRG